MAITAERLMVEVDADTSKAEKGLEGFSDKGARSFGWIGAAGAAVAGLGVAAAAGIGVTIGKAGDLEQSVGAVDSVFRESAGAIHGWASQAATSVGLTTDAYNSSASVIGAMLTNYGVAADKVAASTNDVVGYGADLAAMFGGTTQEAVDALGSALRGEADPAERFGLSLSKTKVQAHMAATGITSQAEATLDLIRTQMEASGAMGQFTREGDTLQGAQARLTAGWANITASIGGLFLPAAAAGVGALASFLPRIQGVVDGLTGLQALVTTGDFTGNVFGWAEDSAPVDFILDLRDAFTQAGGGFDGFQAAAQTAFDGVVSWLTGGGIQMILDAVLAGRERLFGAAMQVFPAIIDGAVSVLPGLVTFVTGVMLPQLIGLIVTSAPMLLGAAVSLFTGLVGGLTQVIPVLLTSVATLLPQLLGSLLAMLPGLLGAAVSLFMSLIQAVATVLPALLTAVLGMLPGLIGTLLGMLPGLLSSAIELFMALVDAVLTILPELLTTLIGTVLPNLLTTVLDMLPDLLGTAITLFLSLVTAITKALPKILTALLGILPTLIATLVGMVPQLIGAAITLFLALVIGLGKAVPQILAALGTMGLDMIRAVGNIDLAAAGRTILDGFLRGLKAGFESVKDFVGGIGDWIAEHKGPKAYDLALLQPAGGWIMSGLREGITAGIPDLRRTLGAVSSTIAGGITAAPRAGLTGTGLTPAAMGATGGGGLPSTLVIVDADRQLIGTLRVQAGKVATGQVTPLDEGRARW